jgi:hypothetical protein
LFAAAACILAVAGVFKIAHGLHAPPWIGVALASPGFVWAADNLYEMMSSVPRLGVFSAFNSAAHMALLAAAAGALRLAEMISRPREAFRVGYGLLAASMLPLGVGLFAHATGWVSTNNALYATAARALAVSAALIAYGAFIGAGVLISLRRNIERWTAAAISLISAYMLCRALSPMFLDYLPGRGDGLVFWLQPVVMLVGGAALWRMGTVLRAQALPEPSVPGQPLPSAVAEPSK